MCKLRLFKSSTHAQICVVFQRNGKKSNSDTSTASMLNFMSLFLKSEEVESFLKVLSSLNTIKVAHFPCGSFLEMTKSFCSVFPKNQMGATYVIIL